MPQTIEEFEMDSKDSLQYFKHILILGGERTGKTTLASILVNKLPSENVLYVNHLKEQGIQYFRNEVKYFCQTTSSSKKTIVIDSLDDINEQTQQIFLNYIDKYGHNVTFIAIGVNPQKIIESMYSRFMIVKLKPVKEEYLRALMERVIKNENIQIEEDAIPYIMSLSNYSVRTVLNYLEKYKILNIPITKEYIHQTHTDIHSKQFETFTAYLDKSQKKEAMNCIVQLFQDGYSTMDILDAYYVFIKQADLKEEYKYKIIKIICKYIVIFNNIHEHHIELLFFVNDCINISSEFRI